MRWKESGNEFVARKNGVKFTISPCDGLWYFRATHAFFRYNSLWRNQKFGSIEDAKKGCQSWLKDSQRPESIDCVIAQALATDAEENPTAMIPAKERLKKAKRLRDHAITEKGR